jgi:hypothetical protein
MPAEAGIQNYMKSLDSRFRGNDNKGIISTFYDAIKIDFFTKKIQKTGGKHEQTVMDTFRRKNEIVKYVPVYGNSK